MHHAMTCCKMPLAPRNWTCPLLDFSKGQPTSFLKQLLLLCMSTVLAFSKHYECPQKPVTVTPIWIYHLFNSLGKKIEIHYMHPLAHFNIIPTTYNFRGSKTKSLDKWQNNPNCNSSKTCTETGINMRVPSPVNRSCHFIQMACFRHMYLWCQYLT